MMVKFSLALLVCLFTISIAAAQGYARLDEAATRAFIEADRLQTKLVFENKSRKFSAAVRLEILDADDNVLAQTERRETIKRGKRDLSLSLPFVYSAHAAGYLWYRLRYTVTPIENSETSATSGIVSLSEITPEIFELRAVAGEDVRAGMNYRVRVRAFQPVTGAPASGVKITGEVELDTSDDSDELKLKATGATGRDGYATLDFTIPANANLDDDGEVKITGERNGVEREAEEDLDVAEMKYSVYLNTDKPIYQPNQTLRARGLFLRGVGGAASTKALAERELEFTVKDEDDQLLYRETVVTSRFGIASISWQIPENAKLGTYKITVDSDDEELNRDQINFKVSRYDLPNFSVNTKSDKTYYLPADQTAEVAIGANYLFGKPVAKGAVKVVEEASREWNYAAQKWEIKEEKSYAGETDAAGKYVAKIDLSKAHADLKENEYERFEDLHFAAYFTDAATNRTEQRRFDLRVTKEAIHVYVVGIERYDDQNPKLPVRFYVSAFYADGAPAACAVEVVGKYEDEENFRRLARLKTNALGAGKVEFTAPKRSDEIYYKDLQIKVAATDAENRKGTQEEEISMDEDEKRIQIATDRAIYRAGEPIKIELASTENERDVFVDVIQNLAVIESRIVRLKNNRATLKIPYNPAFVNALTVAAYIDSDGGEIKTARRVAYPRPTNLQLDAAPAQVAYRPNEEAKVDFKVTSLDKSVGEIALGVFVFDKAIEERARADAEFGGSYVNQFGDYDDLLDGDGNLVDTSKPIDKDLQLKAELAFSDSYFNPNFFASDEYKTNLKTVFKKYFDRQFEPIENALENSYAKDFSHPIDDEGLIKILSASEIDFVNLRDPWGNSYRAFCTVERDESVVAIKSAGANKTFDDENNITVLELKFKYFTPVGLAIDRAVFGYHARTKKFVRDYETLREELKKQNVDLDALRDRWNNPYRIVFGVERRNYTINFRSDGSDGKFETAYDNFNIWENDTDFFAEDESRMQAILSNYANAKKSFPKDEAEFKEILKSGDIDFDKLRDGWNRPLRLEFEISARFADRVKTESVAKYGEQAKQRTTTTPVTLRVAVFRVMSAGANGVFGDADDATLTAFSGIVSEQSKADAKPVLKKTETVFTGGKGAVRGKVIDQNEAVVAGVKMTAANEQTNAEFEAETDEDGVYILKNLPTGKYTIRAEAAGFAVTTFENVPVRSSNLTTLDFRLSVAGGSVDVTVSGEGALIDSNQAQLSTSYSQTTQLPINGRAVSNLALLSPGVLTPGDADFTNDVGISASGNRGRSNNFQLDGQDNNDNDDKKDAATSIGKKSTPRLRQYFPETLVWQPELVTDANGRAELKFKLGDNITTWKLYAIASDAEGKIGMAEREIKAFQPFFADLEPPKFLTVGDEISLPVQIRNYSDAKQSVAVEMAKGNWFDFTNSPTQQIEVAPGSSANAVFGFRANAPTGEGKQRVTAIADKDSDAIEKPVTVRPNGKEIVRTQSEIFRDSISFDANFPANALPDTQQTELKIYPNLLAHVAESIEGLLQRPYGCGEQTISSTYPNLMILKFVPKDNNLRTQAEKFTRKGYERLLGYQHADGGFSVWAKDAPDVALTAYALRFLTDAKSFIDIDEAVINSARSWLTKQQRADGSWTRMYSYEKAEDAARTKLMTTYAARTLAMVEKNAREKSVEAQAALKRALDYLKTRNAEIDEPYALALFGLASFDAGNFDDAKATAAKLETLAIAENTGAYWTLETNTPFYGWGTAGRIETTALVVQLLIKVQSLKSEVRSPKAEDLISEGTIFLLKNKDRYGVWYSTQTTVNVLDAFLAAVGNNEARATNENRAAEIFVNNQKLKTVSLPPENSLTFPIIVNVPPSANANRIEIKIGGGSRSALMAQTVQTHYVSWQDYAENERGENQSRALRLGYDCDRREAKPTEEINCSVEAERIGFKGYGMLLAEIGLPPGADVDRASLEKAKAENWNFSRYDILPDRIIVYLWAQAGGAKFNFKFKPRYGINAQTAPSVVYDYYNPEAQATVAPLKFSIK